MLIEKISNENLLSLRSFIITEIFFFYKTIKNKEIYPRVSWLMMIEGSIERFFFDQFQQNFFFVSFLFHFEKFF